MKSKKIGTVRPAIAPKLKLNVIGFYLFNFCLVTYKGCHDFWEYNGLLTLKKLYTYIYK